MTLFRIHIKPSGGNNDLEMTFQHCIDNNILGIGYRLDNGFNGMSWEEYEKQSTGIHNTIKQFRYIYNHVRPEDLVWTRDLNANYYLARISSSWEYFETDFSRNNNIDVANVFRYEDVIQLQLEDVPGSVVSAFYSPRAIQQIHDAGAGEYSKHIWNKNKKSSVYDVHPIWDLFTVLDPEQVEDLVFIYLQTLGWYVIPNSRKANTIRFEYMILQSNSKIRGLVQVKTGQTPLCPAEYAKNLEYIFLFQSNNIYNGEHFPNVTCIRREDLIKFVEQSRDWLPRIFITKLDQVMTHA